MFCLANTVPVLASLRISTLPVEDTEMPVTSARSPTFSSPTELAETSSGTRPVGSLKEKARDCSPWIACDVERTDASSSLDGPHAASKSATRALARIPAEPKRRRRVERWGKERWAMVSIFGRSVRALRTKNYFIIFHGLSCGDRKGDLTTCIGRPIRDEPV